MKDVSRTRPTGLFNRRNTGLGRLRRTNMDNITFALIGLAVVIGFLIWDKLDRLERKVDGVARSFRDYLKTQR